MNHRLKLAQSDIEAFMRLAGQTLPKKPTPPTREISTLRIELIREEWEELCASLGYEVIDGKPYRRDQEPNLVEAADALADLIYVVLGSASALGIDLEPVFQEVQRSNMSKFIDGHRREDGKWVKGPSYTPANIGPIIKAQQDA